MEIKIYKITNLINNKVYIGQTIKSGIQFNNYFGGGNKIKNAIKKYGKENFKKEILVICIGQKQADDMEKFYINECDSINNGYNLHIGGQTLGFGINHPNYGRKQSENEKCKHIKAGKNQ